MSAKIIFLGTGGGRFSMITQLRSTAGIRFITPSLNIHLDPGPGSLLHSIRNKLDPRKINVMLISHAHPDHYTDAEVLIEAMTGGALKKRGIVIASHSVVQGNEVCDPALSRYHKKLPEKLYSLKTGENVSMDYLEVMATKAVHTDPDTIGFKIKFKGYGSVGYTSDSEYESTISEYFQDTRVLILCTLRPGRAPWPKHMSTEDAVKIVKETKPELAIITHFGGKMLASNPFKEAMIIKRKTGCNTIAATDGMSVSLKEDSIEIP